jgi:selenocysteine lyase/cysteine desulfurase
VRRFFNAPEDEYEIVFTANASAALKLVGESYPFRPGGVFCLTYDNHNSVNGIREFAHAKGATITYVPVREADLRVEEEQLQTVLRGTRPAEDRLFAYPAQSNFSGVQHPLAWVDEAHELGWDVLLDCAAYAPTNPLDLEILRPDFVPISFYKLFGYPTGVGALIARREKLAKLRRPWFAGGAITLASVQAEEWYRLAPGATGFEDGTLDYLSLPAVEIGLRFIADVGIDTIHTRVQSLTEWLLDALASLRHANGKPLVRIYGPLDALDRGGTISLNLYDTNGHFIDHRVVEERANAARISLRTGCFCNPGGGEVALGMSEEELSACFSGTPSGLTLDDFRQCIDDKSTGAVRISFGLVSNFADAYHFMRFASRFLDKRAIEI